ncbi:MAG: type II toxin-antitoxin system HicB family antitoxin [Thermoanaerobaculia bacterium]
MIEYHINIFWSEADGSWVADVPDLFPCSAFGETPEGALAEVMVAKAAWLESAEARGVPAPTPRYRPHSPAVARQGHAAG